MDNGKNNNGLVIALIIFIVLSITLGGYLVYDKLNNESSTNNNDKDIIDNSNDDNAIKELDLSKCLNNDGVLYSNQSDVVGNYGLSLVINPDKKSITLSIDNDTFMPIANQVIIGSTWVPNSTTVYQIKRFTKNIVDVFIGELGQDASGLTLFFLMDDGTVEYTPLFLKKANSDGTTYYDFNFKHNYTSDSNITDTYFESMGTINGVEDVIKFYNVDANSNGFGYRTTIVAKKDGSFYDLGKII